MKFTKLNFIGLNRIQIFEFESILEYEFESESGFESGEKLKTRKSMDALYHSFNNI